MSIQFRHYHAPEDYQLIGNFLIEHYQPENQDGNWIEPAWEYMHGHPMLDVSALNKIGIWEDDGKLVAVAHFESRLGEAFFQFHPDYQRLRREMLDYAEENLHGVLQKDGRKYLRVYVNDDDLEFLSFTTGRGYARDAQGDRPMAKFVIPDPFPPISLPAGFRLTSLAEACDWAKVNRVLWRGFDHQGEPPSGNEVLAERQKMFDTPQARRDLKIVVENRKGDFVSLCGMFYQPDRQYAYVEPIATDPDYRRLGLGKAAVMEGIRRCGALGAKVAYVGSDQEFYLASGFEVIYTSQCWVRYL
jgi:GNAT superfamily N-acetyltransferase